MEQLAVIEREESALDQPIARPTLEDALLGIAADVSRKGIGKDRRNDFHKYNFRGIDDILNVMSPLLVRHGVTLSAHYGTPDVHRVTTDKNKQATQVFLPATFEFRKGGERQTVHTVGEGMDTNDKAVNKAMSAALKYAFIIKFCVPIVGNDDSDFHSPREESGVKTQPPPRGSGDLLDVDEFYAAVDAAKTREDLRSLQSAAQAKCKATNDAHGWKLAKEYLLEAAEAKGFKG